jgi:hypothetical protein
LPVLVALFLGGMTSFFEREAAAQIPIVGPNAVGGVYVDAEGMLRQTSTLASNDRLEALRQEAANEAASTTVETPSKLRKISLSRLERKVAAQHAAGEPLPADLRYLAGLQRVRFVFFYPDSGDVVLAGPAEGWQPASSGEMVGKRSQHPVLHLEDLLVALRFAWGQNQGDAFLGCSIEPTEQGVRDLANYTRRVGSITPAQAQDVFAGMERALGPQQIKLYGVPGSSRFARVLVAADYRLKRLAMGHDPSPVRKVVSYLDLAAQRTQGSTQPQHRWWFVGEYAAIYHTPDKTAYEFEGHGVKVETGPSLTHFKQPANSPKPTRPALQFAQSFSQNFGELAAQVPVFAELENAIGLAVTATLIRQRLDAAEIDAVDRDSEREGHDDAGWRPEHFLDAQACPIGVHRVPTQTPALASARHIPGRQWIISVSGGVEVSPETIAKTALKETNARQGLHETRRATALPADGAWWWD